MGYGGDRLTGRLPSWRLPGWQAAIAWKIYTSFWHTKVIDSSQLKSAGKAAASHPQFVCVGKGAREQHCPQKFRSTGRLRFGGFTFKVQQCRQSRKSAPHCRNCRSERQSNAHTRKRAHAVLEVHNLCLGCAMWSCGRLVDVPPSSWRDCKKHPQASRRCACSCSRMMFALLAQRCLQEHSNSSASKALRRRDGESDGIFFLTNTKCLAGSMQTGRCDGATPNQKWAARCSAKMDRGAAMELKRLFQPIVVTMRVQCGAASRESFWKHAKWFQGEQTHQQCVQLTINWWVTSKEVSSDRPGWSRVPPTLKQNYVLVRRIETP